MEETSSAAISDFIDKQSSSAQAREEQSVLQRYKTQIAIAPRTHRAFLCIVCLQCIYIVIERVYVFTSDFEPGNRAAVWFFLVILVSMLFLLYFAFHSVVHVNVSALLSILRFFTFWW